MNSSIEKKAYQILQEIDILPKTTLDRVYQESETSDQTFSKLLVREGHIKEDELLQIYSKKFSIPFVRLRNYKVDKLLLEKVPVKFTYYYRFFPMTLQNRKLTIAVSRLIDIRVLDEMRFGLGYEIELNLSPENDVEDMLKSYYGVGSETIDKMLAQSAATPSVQRHEEKEDVQDLEKLAETASVVQLVNQIILEAYKKRASDIHFEPFQGRVRLRYRIDGVLREAPVPAEINQFFNAILSRIKIMANLNIVERRLPQDGKARVKVQQEMIDLRVSSIPTPYGESMVIRILPNQKFLTLNELGFESDQLTIFHELLQRPNGIIFVTGPTGSGKSTTLNAALNVLNHPDRKIITIEDPVEYDIPGVTQINVQPEIGLTFAVGLRSVLRHDPDIMMVGEVRDFETADIAIRVALTGHLILSTLHTNDSASGVTRLLDIGVEPFLIASSVIAFTAQRLIRAVCKHCKEEDPAVLPEVKAMIARDLKMDKPEEIRIFRGRGCEACNQTGFQGRMVIQEILVVDSSLRELIIHRASAETIKRHACSRGMVTLRQDGWKKVLKGLTVPEEIIRVTPGDESGDWSTSQEVSAGKKDSVDLTPVPQAWIDFKETEDNFSERRKYVRISVQFRIIFRVIDMEEARKSFSPETFILDGTTQDISAGGVCFCAEAKVSPDDILELKIGIPDDFPVIQCIGRVLRVSYTESGSESGKALWRIAVSFLAIHSEDRKRIELYCQRTSAS